MYYGKVNTNYKCQITNYYLLTDLFFFTYQHLHFLEAAAMLRGCSLILKWARPLVTSASLGHGTSPSGRSLFC